MTEGHDPLDLLGESMGSIAHEGNKPKPSISDELLEFVNEDPVFGWLVNESKIDDDSIRIAADRLLIEVESEPSLRKYTRSLEDVGLDEEAESKFILAVKGVCKLVQNDLNKNKGLKFRNIIRNTDVDELNEVLGNEDIREWLKSRPGGVNVYDVQEAVVKATILVMAPRYMEMIQDLNSEDKGTNFSQN